MKWDTEIEEKILLPRNISFDNIGSSLIILDSHPLHLNDESMVVLISLYKVNEQFKDFNTFFRLLIQFVNGDN